MAKGPLDHILPTNIYPENYDYFTEDCDSDLDDPDDLGGRSQNTNVANNGRKNRQALQRHTLTSLPGEIRAKIINLLDPYSAGCLAVTNSAFYGIFRKVHGERCKLTSRFCDLRCGYKPPALMDYNGFIDKGCYCGYRRKLYLYYALRWFFPGCMFCVRCVKFKSLASFDAELVMEKLIPARYWHSTYYMAFKSLELKGYRSACHKVGEEAAFRAEVDWDAIWPQQLTTDDYLKGTRRFWGAIDSVCARCTALRLCLMAHHYQFYDLIRNKPQHAVCLRRKRAAVQDKTGAWSREGEEVPHQRSMDKGGIAIFKKRAEWGPGHGRYMTDVELYEWLGI